MSNYFLIILKNANKLVLGVNADLIMFLSPRKRLLAIWIIFYWTVIEVVIILQYQ